MELSVTPIELTLQPEEAALLHQVLRNYVSNLRMEIAGTDAYSLRQELKHDEEVIKRLIARLAQAGAAP